jgi:hypothetical protein
MIRMYSAGLPDGVWLVMLCSSSLCFAASFDQENDEGRPQRAPLSRSGSASGTALGRGCVAVTGV